VAEDRDSKQATLVIPFSAQPAAAPVVVAVLITKLLLMEYLLGMVQAPDEMEPQIPAVAAVEDLHATLGNQTMAPIMEFVSAHQVVQAQPE
jgi:hypothetical protein